MSTDLRGALGGSRLLDQPAHRDAVARWQAFLAAGRPVLVEIGFDHGRRLSHTARHHPDWHVAGLEVRRLRVAQAQERAARDGLHNLLAWRIDARTVLAAATPPASLDVVEALFPDPWWNPVHRDRRLLVTPVFLDHVAQALRPGGVLHLATDVADYADHIDGLLAVRDDLVVDRQAEAVRPSCTVVSRREWSCARDGLAVRRWWLRRR